MAGEEEYFLKIKLTLLFGLGKNKDETSLSRIEMAVLILKDRGSKR